MEQADRDHDLLTRLDEKVQTLQAKMARAETLLDDLGAAHGMTRGQTISITTTVSAVGAVLVKLFWN
jgi:hypothetical protein